MSAWSYSQNWLVRACGQWPESLRYRLDLNSTNENFDLYRGKGAKNEDWYAWGRPLYASGDGKEVGPVDTSDMLESP